MRGSMPALPETGPAREHRHLLAAGSRHDMLPPGPTDGGGMQMVVQEATYAREWASDE
jgi:hypothetical protein